MDRRSGARASGRTPLGHPPRLDTVVVAGASVAGLLAAAAVAPHTRHVVLVERDPLPDGPGPRPGTPQAQHTHGLLGSGRMAIETLLPGTTEDLLARGALSGDIGTQGRWYVGGARVRTVEVGSLGLGLSRPLLEAYLRERVRRLPNVTLLDRTDVRGLLSDGAGAVTGVRCGDRADGRASERQLRADLVVDATGRPGRASRWFAEHGWPVPPEERVDVGVRYLTTHVAQHPGELDGTRAVISAATARVPRFATAILQEDGTWVVTLAGYLEERPPGDVDGCRAFARTVAAPEVSRLLDRHEPLHPPWRYRYPHCVRRRIEGVDLPDGYAVVGDALCSFDPTFGQGMSVAALEAVALRQHLSGADADGLAAVLAGYHRAATTWVDRAWSIVLVTVLQIDGVRGATPWGHRTCCRYAHAVQRAARHDERVARELLRVLNLIDPLSALMRPTVAWRVVRAGLLRSRRRQDGRGDACHRGGYAAPHP